MEQNDNNALLKAARTAKEQGNEVMALALFSQAIANNEGNLDARYERAQLLTGMGDAHSALDDARWLQEHGRKELAVEIYNKVYERFPELLKLVSGDFTAEGREHCRGSAPSALNPFGV